MDTVRGVSAVLRVARRALGSAASVLAVYVGILACYYYSTSPGHVRRHHLESAWFWIVVAGILHVRLPARDQEPPVEPPWTRRAFVIAAFAAGATTLWLYWPTLGFGFFSDDFVLLARAARHEWIVSPSSEFVRPVPLLGWALIGWAFGSSPFWYHAFSLTLHSANGVLVFALASRVGLPRQSASVAAAVFLVNPMSVEAVAWPSGVQDLLMTAMCLFFVLAALSRHTISGAAAGAAGLVLGLFSKETAIVAPVLALLAWLGSSRLRVSSLRVVGVGALVCIGYVAWRFVYFDVPASFLSIPSGYMVKELVSRPFAGLAVPWSDRVLDAYPALGMASVLFFALLVVLVGGTWRAAPPRMLSILTWAAWVVVSVLPVYSYFYVSPELQGSRYLYLGSCGWAILVVLLIRSAVEGRGQPFPSIGVILTAMVVVVGCLGIRSALRPWSEADRLRGLVVEAAVRTVSAHACGTYAFEELPDSVEGAYVFRNGFPEALQMRTGAALATHPDGASPGCRFRWDGQAFVQAGSCESAAVASMLSEPVRSGIH